MKATIKTVSGESVKLPVKVVQEIESAIGLRARAKGLEDEAKIYSTQAKDTLQPLLSAYDIKAYSIPDVGTASRKVSKGSSIPEKALREALLLEGMAGVRIDFVLDKVRKRWETEYVDFRR